MNEQLWTDMTACNGCPSTLHYKLEEKGKDLLYLEHIEQQVGETE